MAEQEKRGVGRPPIPDKEPTQDIHLNLSLKLVQALDASRGKWSRKDYIRMLLLQDKQIQNHLDQAEKAKFHDKKMVEWPAIIQQEKREEQQS